MDNKDIKTLTNTLNKLISVMEEIKSEPMYQKIQIQKNIEDGILNNLDKANKTQLKNLKNFKWKYYTELNNPDNLQKRIIYELRYKKIENIIS